MRTEGSMADGESALREGLIEANRALIALGAIDRRERDTAISETVRTCLLIYSDFITFKQATQLSPMESIQLQSVLDRLKKELRLYGQDV